MKKDERGHERESISCLTCLSKFWIPYFDNSADKLIIYLYLSDLTFATSVTCFSMLKNSAFLPITYKENACSYQLLIYVNLRRKVINTSWKCKVCRLIYLLLLVICIAILRSVNCDGKGSINIRIV